MPQRITKSRAQILGDEYQIDVSFCNFFRVDLIEHKKEGVDRSLGPMKRNGNKSHLPCDSLLGAILNGLPFEFPTYFPFGFQPFHTKNRGVWLM